MPSLFERKKRERETVRQGGSALASSREGEEDKSVKSFTGSKKKDAGTKTATQQL